MKLLIIEDDNILRSGLTDLLVGAGYEADSAASVRGAKEAVASCNDYSLCLVDLMLADGMAFDLIKHIRSSSDVPIIILTALNDEDTVIKGLSCGADDYVTKPFRAGELLARIDANLRRSLSGGTIISGHIEYRLLDGRLLVNGEEKFLRRGELQLLELFLKSGGRLLTREYIFDSIWANDSESVEENTLSVRVSRLRRELGTCDGRSVIETVRGVGYRWVPPCTVKN